MRQLPKVSIPETHHLVARPRLVALLARQGRSATWLSGQAGAGKTSCAAAFARASNRPILWLTIDADDSDPATFFYYLGEAAKSVASKHRSLSFTPDFKDGLLAFARRYARHLVQCLPPDCLLVIDNLEVIGASCVVHKVIVHLIKELNAEQSLLITNRTAPPPAYAGLLVQGQLGVISNEELRFTETEAERLRELSGDAAGPSAKALHSWAQGWAAAMVLGLENPGQLQTELPEGRAPQAVFDYFAGEILEGLSADEQDLLLRTSLLPQFTAKQAVSICHQPRSESILERFVERNFFVTRFSTGRKTQYRYHPLFRAFLQTWLREKVAPEELRALFLDAAELMIQGAEIEGAVALLHAAEDWHALDALICAHAKTWLANGFHRRLLVWADVPADFAASAAFCFWRGMARLPFGPAEAREDLVRAHRLYVDARDVNGILLSAASVMESILFSWSSFEKLDEWMDVIDHFVEDLGRPSLPIMGRVAGMMYSASMFRRLGHASSARWEKTAKRFLRVARVIDPGDYILLANSVLVHDLNAGEVEKGRALVDSLATVRKNKRVHPNAQIAYFVMVSVAALYSGNWNACFDAAEEGLALGEELGIHFWDAILSSHAAMGAVHTGRLKAAKEYADFLSEESGTGGHLGAMHDDNTRSLIAMVEGDFPLALVHCRRALESSHALGSVFVEHSIEMALTQIQIELANFEEARAALERAHAGAVQVKCPQSLARVALLDAEMKFAQGQTSDARAALASGLSLMRELNLRSLPFWYPKSFRSLCVHALEANIEVDVVHDLIAYHHLKAPPGAEDVWPETVRLNVLGELNIRLNGKPLEVGKAQKRPVELLQVLAALGGVRVSETTVASILWPDAEGDAANQSMKVTVHRLRKLLGDSIVHRADGAITVDRSCRIDGVECGAAFRDLPALDDKLADAIDSYRGPLLPHVDDAWVFEPRQHLERAFSRAVLRVYDARLDAGRTEDARVLLEKAIRAAPGVESLYAALIRSLRAVGRQAEAADVLRHCEVALFHFHQVQPSEELYVAERERPSAP